MFAAIFAPVAFTTGPTQPPVDTTTLYVGTIGWGPRDADPKISYDTGSGQLLFNCYEQLIRMGTSVDGWDVQEQYWEFEPSLATNVPDRVEVVADFTNDSFVWTIVIRNEIPMGPEWMLEPNCTWWEDDLAQPFNSYHITDWIDSEPQDGILGFCDYIQMNDYWWEPEIPMEVQLKGCSWWHVEEIQDHGEGWWKMILTYTTRTDFDPADPESTWWTSPSYPETYFHLVGFIDNNPVIPGVSECDVVYMMEYMWVPVDWIKIGPGWTLLPVTCRTWHVIGWDVGVTLYLHRWYYDFNIRTDPIVYFQNETGDIVDTMDIYDVEYSFERGFVVDSRGGPNWMLALPTMDLHDMSGFDTGDPADWLVGLYLIDDAFEIISVDPPIFRINTGIDFPDIAFKQVLAQSWSAIMSKDFAASIGGWDGELFLDVDQDCFADWIPVFWGTDDNPFENDWRYAGTGPYYVSIVDDVNDIVVLEKCDVYWGGWPAPDRKAYLDRIDIEYISAWETRRDAFIACQIDTCAVPRAYMSELLDEFGEPNIPEVVTIKNIYPGLALDCTHYTFDLNPASPYIGTGSFPDGIPPLFFNNTHVRKAFSYAFNRTQYLDEGYHGEAICRETPLISGLAPDYYSYGPDPPYVYDESLAMAQAELSWQT
jgi:ABC-type transport system substrate-binding protein